MRRRIVEAGLFLNLCLCICLSAQQHGGTVKARILDESGSPLPGVTVSIKHVGCDCKNCNDPETCECCPDENVQVSDAEGIVRFIVIEGQYSVSVSMDGFATITKQVDVVAGRTVELAIQLSPDVVVG